MRAQDVPAEFEAADDRGVSPRTGARRGDDFGGAEAGEAEGVGARPPEAAEREGEPRAARAGAATAARSG